MNEYEINEILNYINTKYNEHIPSAVRFVVRRKAKSIETFQVQSLPNSLANCTVAQLILIVQQALRQRRLQL